MKSARSVRLHFTVSFTFRLFIQQILAPFRIIKRLSQLLILLSKKNCFFHLTSNIAPFAFQTKFLVVERKSAIWCAPLLLMMIFLKFSISLRSFVIDWEEWNNVDIWRHPFLLFNSEHYSAKGSFINSRDGFSVLWRLLVVALILWHPQGRESNWKPNLVLANSPSIFLMKRVLKFQKVWKTKLKAWIRNKKANMFFSPQLRIYYAYTPCSSNAWGSAAIADMVQSRTKSVFVFRNSKLP